MLNIKPSQNESTNSLKSILNVITKIKTKNQLMLNIGYNK